MEHPFHRCGLAALSDLETEPWRELWNCLLGEQERFLAHETEFRSREYSWPRDALRNWSRVWEYPYVHHHLREERRTLGRPLRILDVGSGVAFFPFANARLGNEVMCVDVDPICVRDVQRAIAVVDASPGTVAVRQSGGIDVAVADGWADVVVSVSVLEHVEDKVALLLSMAAALRPGGLCILTLDLDLRGDFEIGPLAFRQLQLAMDRHFEPAFAVRTIHPQDLLRSTNGPFGFRQPPAWPRLRFHTKQRLRALLGQRPRPLYPFELIVEGLVLRRR